MPSTGRPRGIGQDDVGGQVLVLGPQAVGRPRADARPARDDQAGVHHPERLLVIAVLGVHRANHGDLVGVPSDAAAASRRTPGRDWPCRENLNGLPSRLPVSFSSSATSAGGGWPSYLASIGLGSSKSTWLGPPCMNSWMTASRLRLVIRRPWNQVVPGRRGHVSRPAGFPQ